MIQCDVTLSRVGMSSFVVAVCLLFASAHAAQNRSSATSNKTSSISPHELRTISEELLALDINNLGNLITLDRQGKTISVATDDPSPRPLFKTVPENEMNKGVYKIFKKLLDNYDPNVNMPETQTDAEQKEEKEFLDAIANTQVVKRADKFLKDKNMVTGTIRSTLKELWFTPYSRGRANGSTAFEHTFIGELKKGEVSGFHNWMTFHHEEKNGALNYKGWVNSIDLGNKGEVLKIRFDWKTQKKPAGTIFVGTSPEFEMALYTVCFMARPDSTCPVQLNGQKFGVRAYSIHQNGRKLVGSIYPQI